MIGLRLHIVQSKFSNIGSICTVLYTRTSLIYLAPRPLDIELSLIRYNIFNT